MTLEDLAARADSLNMTLTTKRGGYVLKLRGSHKLGRDRAQAMAPMPGLMKSLVEVSRWLDLWEGNASRTRWP